MSWRTRPAWDETVDLFTNAVRVAVMTLRRKLGQPPVIEMVPGGRLPARPVGSVLAGYLRHRCAAVVAGSGRHSSSRDTVSAPTTKRGL